MSDKKDSFTLKIAEERSNILAHNINTLKVTLDSIGLAFAKYLRYKGEENDFKIFLENQDKNDKLKESAKKDAK